MHLRFAFLAFTDAFRSSTCIPELIFQQIRITFPSQMHPCQNFPANQDHFSLANASLPEFSRESGSFSPSQMHPCQAFSANQDHFSLENASPPGFSRKSGSFSPLQMHPCQTFSANQDHFPLAKLCWNIDRNQSPALFYKLPVPGQIIHPIYNSGGRYRIEEFGHREVAVIASELEYIADFSVNLLHAVS